MTLNIDESKIVNKQLKSEKKKKNPKFSPQQKSEIERENQENLTKQSSGKNPSKINCVSISGSRYHLNNLVCIEESMRWTNLSNLVEEENGAQMYFSEYSTYNMTDLTNEKRGKTYLYNISKVAYIWS